MRTHHPRAASANALALVLQYLRSVLNKEWDIPEERVVGMQQKTAVPRAMGRAWEGSGTHSSAQAIKGVSNRIEARPNARQPAGKE